MPSSDELSSITQSDRISPNDLRKVTSTKRLFRIGRIIREERGLIIEKWARYADDAFSWHGEISRDELLDHLPLLLEQIGLDLAEWHGENSSRTRGTAETHGEERWKQGWDLANVVRDYQLLRATLTEHLSQRLEGLNDIPLTRAEARLLHQVIDEAIVASVETFAKYKEGLLRSVNLQLEQRVNERTGTIRELSALVGEAEVRERERVARLLHEDVQQMLFAARIKIASLVEPISRADEKAGGKLDDVQELLENAIEAARSLAVDLAPPILAERGLVATLHWLADRTAEQYEIEVETEMNGLDQPDPTTGEPQDDLDTLTETERLFLFRFAQEALLNAAKHSKAKEVRLRLRVEEGMIKLWVIDAGDEGAKLEEAFRKSKLGFGLANLQRRAMLLGGNLVICRDGSGRGACVGVEMPLIDALIHRETIRKMTMPADRVQA